MRSIARSHPWSWMVVAGWLLSVALGVREVGAVCPWAPNQHAIDETNRCYQIKLQWDNVANATQYNIYKRPHDGSDPPINQWTYVGYTYSTPFTLLTSSLPAGEAWKFKIAAVNSNDTSCQPGGVPLAVSNMQPFFVPYVPDPPANVTATAISSTQVRMSWDPPANILKNAVMNIYRGVESTPFLQVNYADSPVTFSQACGTQGYSLEAVSSSDCKGTKVNRQVTMPSAVPALSSPSQGQSITTPDVNLSWAAATCATGYTLQIDDASNFSSPAVNTNWSTTSYTWSNAPEGTYYWRVRSQNAAGQYSSWSAARSFIHPLAITVTAPNCGATLHTGSTYNITWTTSVPVPSVKIEYSVNGGPWQLIQASVASSPYAWVVPDIETNNALVRISSGSVSDVSDCPFWIAPDPGGTVVMEWGRDWNLTQGWYPAVAKVGNTLKIAYHDPVNGFMMATRYSPCNWTYEGVHYDGTYRTGLNSAIAVGPSNVIGVTYLRELTTSSYELRFRRRTTSWAFTNPLLATLTKRAASALAFDASGTAHVVYSDGTVLRHVTVSSSNVVGTHTVIATLPEAGKQSCSIAVDPQGNLCVAFSINVGTAPYVVQNLGFVRRTNGSWAAAQTISTNGGFGVDMALDAQGQPRLTCWSSWGRLLYAKWTNVTSSWSFETVTDKMIEGSTSLVLDANGLAHIAVWHLTNSTDVPTYVREGTSPHWESCPIDVGQVGTGLNIRIGIELQSNGNPLIGYTGVEGQIMALKVAEGLPGVPDVTPPATITDVIVAMGKTTAVPMWTAVGDDGTVGTATNYDVRYSQFPIYNDGDFYAATRVNSDRCPAPAGSGDCESVTGLNPCMRYYFAVKVRDNAGNWSAMSNTATDITRCGFGGQEVFCEPGIFARAPGDNEDDAERLPERLAFTIASSNPVRGPASLNLEIPATDAGSDLNVSVYDPQGRRVRSLLKEQAVAGRRTLTWDLRGDDGTRVRHGIYFVRTHLGSQSIVRTLIVLE